MVFVSWFITSVRYVTDTYMYISLLDEVPEGTDMIDVHGRRVPAPPRKAPPPVPSPNARRPSISNIKYVSIYICTYLCSSSLVHEYSNIYMYYYIHVYMYMYVND